MTRSGSLTTATVIAFLVTAQAVAAQTAAATSIESRAPAVRIDGPAPPIAPAVVARDGAGRTTARAVRLESPITIDGRLDEAVYETVPAMTDFIQQDPVENAPATEKTEVWVFFDDDAVYVVGKCWDSHPERMIVNEMRRDGSSIPRNENFGWMLDTFYDRRNGVFFEVTPLGGRLDAQVANERNVNTSWNAVWEVKTARFEQGWAVEAKIPFKSLRYRPGSTQVWGFQVRRKVQWKNERSYLSPVPASVGEGGHFRAISLAATLVGIEAPSGSKNLELKPYLTSHVTTDRSLTPHVLDRLDGDVGLDVKYGLSQNLTADFTYNTDFAQVEADEQQVNLTRFSLFFPEKREFFLENQGTFDFGGAGATAGAGSANDTPVLFYSRRVGLNRTGTAIPIVGGGRLTGRVGPFTLGAMSIRSDDVPEAGMAGTNFSVVRLKRDVLRKSSVGLIYTGRSISEAVPGGNHAYGIDGSFGFYDNVTINTYWARTSTAGSTAGDASYRAQFNYAGDRYGLEIDHLTVGANFNPEVGFVRRLDMRRHFAEARFSPRTEAHPFVRKLYWTGSLEYVENGAGRVETRTETAAFQTDFHNGDRVTLDYTHQFEFLPAPLPLTRSAIVPVGSYEFQNVKVGYNYAPTRQVLSGNISAEHGSFYNGTKTTIAISQGRLVFPPHLALEPTYSMNKVDLAQGRFTTHLVGGRVNVTITPLMFIGALVQYNSTAQRVSSNVRFRWEYQPGSELFIVYNDQRDTAVTRSPGPISRALIVKINRLFRF